jgi:hypothetical protein
MTDPWPFAAPPNVAVFTSKQSISGDAWIHYVSHDEDDGAWQFHPVGFTTEEDAAVVGLGTIVRFRSCSSCTTCCSGLWRHGMGYVIRLQLWQ